MKTALDTNVVSELLGAGPRAEAAAQALNALRSQGLLLICGVVYAELHGRAATPGRLIDEFLTATGITLDVSCSGAMFSEAARANADYHARRRAGGLTGVRPVLPDLLIGAHAQVQADRLLTLNPDDFSDFPQLRVLTL